MQWREAHGQDWSNLLVDIWINHSINRTKTDDWPVQILHILLAPRQQILDADRTESNATWPRFDYLRQVHGAIGQAECVDLSDSKRLITIKMK